MTGDNDAKTRRMTAAEPAASREAPDELRQSLFLLSAMVELTADGILVVDGKGDVLKFNQTFLKLWSIPEFIISSANDRQLMAYILDQLKDPETFLQKAEEIYARPKEESFDTVQFKDGKVFECYSQPHRVAEQTVCRVWSFRDVTALSRTAEEQRRSRETAERLAKEIAVLAEIGRVIGSTLDIETVYERFAAEAKKLIPFDRLAINLIKSRESVRLNAYVPGRKARGASPGSATEIFSAYISGLDIPGRRPGDTFPLVGSANELLMHQRRSLLIQPASREELAAQYPSLLLTYEAGLNSMLSVPLISRDIVIGALHFRAKKPNAYTEQDVRLAERIGAQIAGAIANAQLFIDLKESEKFLRENEARFRAIFDQAAVGVAEVENATGRFMRVNRCLCNLLGRTEAEMLRTNFQAITHPEDLHIHEEGADLLMAGKIESFTIEKRYIRKDGAIIWVSLTISPLWKSGEACERRLIIAQDISERKRLDSEMREMFLRDQLTELYNRRGFINLAEHQLKAAVRAKRQMLLTFLDVDGLKWINDNLGHEEGDRNLIDAANVLRQTFRESDIIARLGGDEFAVLSIDATGLNPKSFSKRLQQNIDACNATGARRYKLSLSWGAVVYDHDSPATLDGLMSAADELMYAQKRTKATRRS